MAFRHPTPPLAEATAVSGNELSRIGRLPPAVWPRSDCVRDINEVLWDGHKVPWRKS